MPASEHLFISEQHPISQRWAVIEDDGRAAWLYLTEPGTQKPAADCWLYNRVPTPAHFDSASGEPPVVPATHARSTATQAPPSEESVHLRWSRDGESVAVLFDSELVGFIADGQNRGFSRHLQVSGPFGNALDTELFERVFQGTK
jgi:hypothetical protein